MRNTTSTLEEARTGLALLLEADERSDYEELRTQALHLAEHFDELDKALASGARLPGAWSRAVV